MTAEAIHTCSYSCERPGCIRAQRDELVAKVEALRAEVERLRTDGASAVRWAPGSAYWSEVLVELFGPDARKGIDVLEARWRKEIERAERLAEALRRAHRWGGLGKGWDSGVALDLIAWIESGMHGELPPLPDYLAAALAQEDCNG